MNEREQEAGATKRNFERSRSICSALIQMPIVKEMRARFASK